MESHPETSPTSDLQRELREAEEAASRGRGRAATGRR